MMTNNVQMPPRIAKLDRDPRGYPIPWNVLRGEDGTPFFTCNDSSKHMKALTESLCPLCGEKLGKWKWFVGGPRSAFMDNGWYIDLPAHRSCAEYALQVCPYLAAPRYEHRVDLINRSKLPPAVIAVDPTVEPDRPPLFVAVAAQNMELNQNAIRAVQGWRNGDLFDLPYVRPERPFLGVQYWQHGKQLSEADGAKLAAEALRRGLEEKP